MQKLILTHFYLECDKVDIEPKQRAQSPELAAWLASELKIDDIPYGRRFPGACCGELQMQCGMAYTAPKHSKGFGESEILSG